MVQPIKANFQFLVRGSAQTAAISTFSETSRAGKREILQESFLSVSKKTPSLELTSPLGGFRVNDANKFLTRRFKSNGLPAVDHQDKRDGFLRVKGSKLEKLKKSFEKLRTLTSSLHQTDSLQTRFAKSSRPDFLQANALGEGPEGEFDVVRARILSQNVLVSGKQTRPLSALGLTGSFFVNGTKVMVELTDSIVQLRDKINFGEDKNKNSRLDFLEDVNANGVLDIHQIEPNEFGSGVFIIEDANDNGLLDPSEDLDHDGRLDGGSGEHKVSADILRDRLFLTSLAGGTQKIDLRDPDGILQSLEFFVTDSKGNAILKETEIDFDRNPPEELMKTPQKAVLKIEDDIVVGNSDSFDNAIEGVRLEIKKPTDLRTKVTIFTNAVQLMKTIEEFFSGFNNTLRELNKILSDTREFERDQDIQRLWRGLTGETKDKIQKLGRDNEDKEKFLANRRNQSIIGLEVFSLGKNTFQELTLGRTVDEIKGGLAAPFHNPGPEVQARLNSIGIRTNEDNTIRVNRGELKVALEINKGKVLDILINPDTGLLPTLEKKLSRVLKEELGDIALKKTSVALESEIPGQVSEGFKKLTANNTLRDLGTLLELDGRGLNLNAIA